MDMINTNNIIRNPTLHYRLDLGEPGIAFGASASQSTLRVASHEIGNMVRFRRMAAEEGKTIIGGGIHLHRQFAGSFLATVSGETVAYMVERKNSAEITPDNNTQGLSKDNLDEDSLLKSNATAEERPTSPPSLDASGGIAETAILAQLYAKKSDLEQKKNIDSEEQNAQEFQEKIDKVNQAIQKLIGQRLFETQEKILNTIEKANDATTKLAGVPDNSTKELNDNPARKDGIDEAKKALQL